jgi:hypothetical protein
LEFASRPYGPILDVLARVDASPFELGAAATKQEQFDAIVDRFASIASRTALVVVVEDLHWADAATLDLLAYLGTRLHHMRVLGLASFRPDELHPDHPATAATAKVARNARAGRRRNLTGRWVIARDLHVEVANLNRLKPMEVVQRGSSRRAQGQTQATKRRPMPSIACMIGRPRNKLKREQVSGGKLEGRKFQTVAHVPVSWHSDAVRQETHALRNSRSAGLVRMAKAMW